MCFSEKLLGLLKSPIERRALAGLCDFERYFLRYDKKRGSNYIMITYFNNKLSQFPYDLTGIIRNKLLHLRFAAYRSLFSAL